MNRFWCDLSNNNTQTVDWNRYRKVGQHVLVGLKATEADSFIDRTHASRSEHAHQAGVWVAHYHFFHPVSSAEGQARFFWSQIKAHFAARDFAVIDVEIAQGLSNVQVAAAVERFAREFRRISGHTLIAYSDESFAHSIGDCGIRRWWVAAYGQRPSAPRGASLWAWQRTDGSEGPPPHSCVGVGQCDVSSLNLATYLRLRLSKPRN